MAVALAQVPQQHHHQLEMKAVLGVRQIRQEPPLTPFEVAALFRQ